MGDVHKNSPDQVADVITDLAPSTAGTEPVPAVVEKQQQILNDLKEKDQKTPELDNVKKTSTKATGTSVPLGCALVQKIFTDPIRDVIPTGTHCLPTSTELVNGWDGAFRYSPVTWAEPLQIFDMQIADTDEKMDTTYATRVSVNNMTSSIGSPALTPFGMAIQQLILEDLSKPGAVRQLIPTKSLIDQSSIASLMHITRTAGIVASVDEAPIVRLLLLHMCKAPIDWIRSNTRVMQEVTYNTRLIGAKTKITWTTAHSSNQDGDIGMESKTSTIYMRTLDEYVSMLNGQPDRNVLPDGLSLNNVTVIPVKSSWQGKSFLIPYILAHTTTNWWNFACNIVIAGESFNEREDKKEKHLWYKCFMRASTVIIKGTYKHILLVVTDATRSAFGNAGYKLNNKPNVTASVAGNPDFAKIAHVWLGRASDATLGTAGTWEDTLNAYRHMCHTVGPDDLMRRLLVMCAELSTSYFMGWRTYTNGSGSKPAEVQVEVTELIDEDESDSDLSDAEEEEEYSHEDSYVSRSRRNDRNKKTRCVNVRDCRATIAMVDTIASIRAAERSAQQMYDQTHDMNGCIYAAKDEIEAEIAELVDRLAEYCVRRDWLEAHANDAEEAEYNGPHEQMNLEAAQHAVKHTELSIIKTRKRSDIVIRNYNAAMDNLNLQRRTIETYGEQALGLQYVLDSMVMKTGGVEDDDIAMVGPYVFNQATDMSITLKMPDLIQLTSVQRKKIISALNTWRVSPLGRFQQTKVSCKTASSYPAFGAISDETDQYNLCEANSMFRVLSHCDIFQVSQNCDTEGFSFPHDLANYVLGTSVLIASAANMMYMQIGVPLVDFNMISADWESIDPRLFDILCPLTRNFCISEYAANGRATELKSWLTNITAAIGIEQKDVDTWYSLYLPWWFVNSMIEKFSPSGAFTSKVRDQTSTLPIGDDPYGVSGMQGYIVDVTCDSFELSYLSATRAYERAVKHSFEAYFTILLPDAHQNGMRATYVGWNAWKFADHGSAATKMKKKAKMLPDWEKGVVELNCMVFPSARAYLLQGNPKAFISISNRQPMTGKRSQQLTCVPIIWPDPKFTDWLGKGLLKIAPDMITGNWLGAITKGVGHIADGIIDWATSKVKEADASSSNGDSHQKPFLE